MSLDFNYANCAGPSTCPDNPDQYHPVMNALIWTAMSIGLGAITEKNWEEWVFRIRFSDWVAGETYLRTHTDDGPVKYVITVEEIKSYIGLTTNVSTVTRTKFLNEERRKMVDRINREIKKEVADAE